MRYYLDTNMLIFILQAEQKNIHYTVRNILDDCSNTFFASSIAVAELLFLFRIGKLIKKLPYRTENDILRKIEDLGIETKHFSKENYNTYLSLEVFNEHHKDMKDHLIISQAISDKIFLISSDNEFDDYKKQNLKFIFNKR
jgi:PIN domain nuclease of toxin-antitoxin system